MAGRHIPLRTNGTVRPPASFIDMATPVTSEER
jgi:hypothetical protein